MTFPIVPALVQRLMNLNLTQQKVLLFIGWLLVQGGLFYTYGVDATQESLKYIGAAEHLLQKGELPETRYFFYLATTLLIAACLKTGLGFNGVVVFQLLLNLFATFSFFHALRRVQQNKASAFFTLIIFISFLPYQTWNFFLYTESVFYSCALLFFSACIGRRQITWKGLLAQAFFLFLTIIARPLGIIFLPCWILYVAYQKRIKPRVVTALFVLGMVLAVGIVNTIMRTISDWQILRPAEFGYIICDIPSRPALNLMHLKHHAPLVQAGLFVLYYPGEFFRLCVQRLQAFYFLGRWYYSMLHNLYLYFYAVLLGLPFLLSLFFRRHPAPAKPGFHLSILLVVGFTLAILLQCDDYHNRFHHTIVPVFLYGGLFLLLEKKDRTNTLET